MTTTPNCPVCGQEMFPRFSVPCDFRAPGIQRIFSVSWCKACDFGQVWPRPNEQEIPSFYQVEDYYTHRSGSGEQVGRGRRFSERLLMALAWRFDRGEEWGPGSGDLTVGKGARFYDLGCGNGNILAKFRDAGFDAVGVEPDPKAREEAIKAGLNVIEGTAENLPPELFDRPADVVLMSHVLEHCLDVSMAVENAIRLLKPGGILVIEVPNNSATGFRTLLGEWPWADIPRHLNFFTRKSLVRLTASKGLGLIRTRFSGYCRNYSTEWLWTERMIRESFSRWGSGTKKQPNFLLRAWQRFLRTALASPGSKYDSLHIMYRKLP